MNLSAILFFLSLICNSLGHAQNISQSFIYREGNFQISWDIQKDRATAISLNGKSTIWSGSLLPSFWVELNHKKIFIKASAADIITNNNQTQIQLSLGKYGKGKMIFSTDQWGIACHDLEIEWADAIPAIISMYYGASPVNHKKNQVWPSWDKPFMPDWQSAGFCVPGAKEGPAQSYFRNWDFGQANIALGSFGPSIGSPYGAAFPRPLLFAGMGNDIGFVALGAGSIPDAAMSLRVQSTYGCFEYLYNEDIWGAQKNKKRIWSEPLRLSIAENAWAAFKKYSDAFPVKKKISPSSFLPAWNTWGTWRDQHFVIAPVTQLAQQTAAGSVVLDGSWEDQTGNGLPSKKRFEHFEDDIEYIRGKGLAIGVWQAVGWIADPFAQGLTANDLVVNRYGDACKANWDFDTWADAYYCLDPSSAHTRAFIRKRTKQIMQTLKPKLLKLDFGYGLPAPFMGVPRDVKFRGEQYAFEMVSLIAEAAKSIDPDVAIMYYSISPLWSPLEDIVSLDDQGDLWYDIRGGHASWSVWASLLGNSNTVISGSSGYDWDKDDETVLNSCILGPPGAVLPATGKNGAAVDNKYLNRRKAINTWCRKTANWVPLWLNSSVGNLSGPPQLHSWGRLEKKDDSAILTALVLRPAEEKITDDRAAKIKWSGRWALIAQDEQDIFSSHKLAMIPFDSGYIVMPLTAKPNRISALSQSGYEEYKNWEWSDNMLTIRVNDVTDIAGLLIE